MRTLGMGIAVGLKCHLKSVLRHDLMKSDHGLVYGTNENFKLLNAFSSSLHYKRIVAQHKCSLCCDA